MQANWTVIWMLWGLLAIILLWEQPREREPPQ